MDFGTGVLESSVIARPHPKTSSLLVCLPVIAALASGCDIQPLAFSLTPSPSVTAPASMPLASLLPKINSTDTPVSSPPTATAFSSTMLPSEADELIYEDFFIDGATGWETGSTSSGSVTLADGFLILTARMQRTSKTTLLSHPIPPDFYSEWTVRTMLCSEEKSTFGLIFRMQADRSYRYAIGCDGIIRFERFLSNAMEGASRWVESGNILSGAPAENRLGLLAQGGTFRFFANGSEIFSYADPLLTSGQMGFFARTDRSEQLTVSFDNLLVFTLN